MPQSSGYIRIPLARKGDDGEDTVSLEPSTAIVAFSEDTTSVQVTFRAYQGTTQIYVGNIWGSGDFPAGVDIYGQRGSDDLSYVYTFTRTDPSVDIDAQVDFTANISGGTLTASVERTRTLHFLSIEPGENAFSVNIDPPYVFFTEGALVMNVAAKVYYGSEVLAYDDAMRSAEWSDVDGVAITRVSQSGGTVNYRFTRTDANADVDGEATLSLTAAPSGTGISVALAQTIKVTSIVGQLRLDYNPNMVFGPDDTALSQTLTIYRGDIALTAMAVQNSTSITDKATLRGSVNSDGTVAVTVQRTSTDVDLGEGESHSFQVATSNGETIAVPFMVYSFKNGDDGDPGKDGDPGEDAVYYELDCPVTAITYKAIAGAFAPTSFTATLYKVTGDVRELAEGSWNIYQTNTDGDESRIDGGDDFNGWTIYISDFIDDYGYPTQFRVHVRVGSVELTKIITVNSSYAIRGPQRWDDLADSYGFQSGQIGEIYLDVVIHEINGGDNYYYCVNSHVKSEGIEPGTEEKTTGNNGYWQQMNKLDSVATSLLLADYAKVANLYVDDLFMVGQQTCIWLNPDNDGMKINPVSVLDSAERKDQSATAAAWENPLAEFSARNLPSLTDIFGSEGVDRTVSFGTDLSLPTNDGSQGDYIVIVGDPRENYISSATISGHAAGDRISLELLEGGTVSLTEGASVSAEGASAMTLAIAVRFNNTSQWYRVGAITVKGYAASGTVTASTVDTTTIVTAPSDANLFVRLYVDNAQLNVGAKVSITRALEVHATSISYGYAARYCANGMFVGVSTQDYLRFVTTEDSAGAVDGGHLQLMAAGQGFDISSGGAMQTVGTVSMPVGGMLLSGYVWYDTSAGTGYIPRGYFTTWDGIMPTLRRTSLGIYQIIIPTEWAEKIGVMSPWTFAVSVQGRGAGGNVNAYVVTVDYDGKILVGVSRQLDDGSLERADLPFYIQVTYVGGGNVVDGTDDA